MKRSSFLVTSAKHQSEAEARRHRNELDDVQRAADAKLRQCQEDLRTAERLARAAEDTSERLRKQLAEERAGRDYTEGERDALQDKIVSLQRVVAKRDVEITRLQQSLAYTATEAGDKQKEAEAVQSELDLRQAREKKELALGLEQRLKEFRSVSRMRHQVSHMDAGPDDLMALGAKLGEVSAAFLDASAAAGYDERSTATPARPPRASRADHSQVLKSPAVPLTDATPIRSQNGVDSSATMAWTAMQRMLERQLASERDRNEDLHRRLAETQNRSEIERTLLAADRSQPRPASKSTAAPSPRAERLRRVSESLKGIQLPE